MAAPRAKSRGTSLAGTPNLFSFLPVVILACVRASTSGLTLSATATGRGAAFRELAQKLELALRLDVDLQDPAREGELELAPGLAHAREEDARGRNAGGKSDPELALRDDVAAGTGVRHGAHDGERGVRLERIADHRVHVGESGREGAEPALEGRRGIAIEGRADLGRDAFERHLLGAEGTIAIGELAHPIPSVLLVRLRITLLEGVGVALRQLGIAPPAAAGKRSCEECREEECQDDAAHR